MNDFELESKLKSVRIPARTETYWENFPSRMRAHLPRANAGFTPQNSWLPQLAWRGGFALACILFALALWPSFNVFLKNERMLRHELAELPAHLRVLMADEHGLHYLVAEQQ
ncbi:MAG TPA: hypothetical protein VHG71_01410 [Verrucomicrobiae bacterium]|nr:hypothetical protein [Verrucomicrobiae bacterium]